MTIEFGSVESINLMIQGAKKVNIDFDTHSCSCNFCQFDGYIEDATCTHCNAALYGCRGDLEHTNEQECVDDMIDRKTVTAKNGVIACRFCKQDLGYADTEQKIRQLKAYLPTNTTND